MDKKKQWPERIKDIPGWVKAAIGLITPLVGFILLVTQYPTLVLYLIIILLLLYIWGGCLIVAFSKEVIEDLYPPRKVWRFPKYRFAALIGIVITPLLLLSLSMIKSVRETITAVFTTPTPALCFPPAQVGETLVVISSLAANDNTSYDAQSRITTGVDFAINQLKSDLNIRMELCDHTVRTLEEAYLLREQMNATLIIWGYYDQYGITLFYTTNPEISTLDSSALYPEPVTAITPGYIARGIGSDATAWGFFAVAQTLQATAHYEEAIEAYSAIIENLSGELIQGHSDLLLITCVQIGVIYEDFLGSPGTALVYYEKATGFAPETMSAIPYRYRGVAYRQLGNFDAARIDAEKAISLDSGYAHPHLDLAIIDYWIKDYENAELNLKRALSLDPQFSIAYYYSGLVNYALNDPATAVTEFSRAIENDANLYAAYYLRSVVAYKAGIAPVEQILRDLTIAIEGMPNFGRPRLFRATVYVNVDSADLSLIFEDLNILIEDYPELSQEALLYRGLAYYLTKEYESALADFNQVLEEDKDGKLHSHAYYFRGLVFEEQQNYSLALEDFNRMIAIESREELSDTVVAGYYHRGINYLYLGTDHDLQLAEEDLFKSIELGIKPVPAYLVLTDIYLAQKEQCEARYFYQLYIDNGGNPIEGYDDITCST